MKFKEHGTFISFNDIDDDGSDAFWKDNIVIIVGIVICVYCIHIVIANRQNKPQINSARLATIVVTLKFWSANLNNFVKDFC